MVTNIRYISLLAVINCILFQLILFACTREAYAGLTWMNHVALLGLSGTIFLLPDFLEELSKNKKWYNGSEFYTMLIVVLLGVVGYLIGKAAFWLSPLLFLVTLYLLLRNVRKIEFSFSSVLFFITGTILLLFLVAMVYSVYHRFMYLEKIFSGTVHIDVLLHSAISNGIGTYGHPSTLLDGTALFKYHWGSHALFAGMKHFAGVNVLQFYNLEYSILFVPLFLKSIAYVVSRMDRKFNEGLLCLFLVLAFIAVYFSLDKFTYMGQPLASESYTLSLIFSFLTISVLIQTNQILKLDGMIVFVCLSILVIFLMKISTGILLLAGVGYYYWRTRFSWLGSIKIIIGILVVILVVYLYSFPEDRTAVSDTYLHRYGAMWRNTEGIFDYWLGILILIFVVLYKNETKSLADLKKIVYEKKYVVYESLAVVTILGLLGGIAVSSHGNDVIYFSGTQLYFCMPILIVFMYEILEKFKAGISVKIGMLVMLSILSVLAKPEVGIGMLDYIKYKNIDMNKDSSVYSVFLKKMVALDKEDNNYQKCVYIPSTEKWYYDAQLPAKPELRDTLTASYVVPAVSGVANLGGLPQNLLDSDFMHYGLFYHRRIRSKQIADLEEAKKIAQQDGFKLLILYYEKNGQLIEERFKFE